MQNIEQIYKEYFGTVYKYLYCLTHNEDIAEELTQETFYRAIKSIHNFKMIVKYLYGYAKLLKIFGMMS